MPNYRQQPYITILRKADMIPNRCRPFSNANHTSYLSPHDSAIAPLLLSQ